MATRIRNGRNEWAMVDAVKHRYWLGTNEDEESATLGEMIPATKLISQFYSTSPWNASKTAQDIEFGNRVHSVASACLNAHASACLNAQKPNLTPQTEDEKAAFGCAWQFARRIRDNNEVLGVEYPLFTSGANVAGTADVIFKCNGRVYLCDWKTGDAMLPAKCKFNAPFAHLVADPLTIYSLQCSLYQLLIEIGGYFGGPPVFAPARLLWLHKEDGAWKIDALTCRDLRREAATMMLCRTYTPWYKDWKMRCPW